MAQQKAEAQRVQQENATFKPKTNKAIKRDSMQHFNTGQGAAGMQKYLLRQQQAKEMKLEQE